MLDPEIKARILVMKAEGKTLNEIGEALRSEGIARAHGEPGTRGTLSKLIRSWQRR